MLTIMECERELDASAPSDGKIKSTHKPLNTGPVIAKSGLAKGLVQQRGLAAGKPAEPEIKEVYPSRYQEPKPCSNTRHFV